MLNYFKAIDGHLATHNLTEAHFFFDAADPEAMRRALRDARATGGVVSVWERAPTVPGYIPVIGEPVQVLTTAADYLAKRRAENAEPVASAVGGE